MDAAIAEAKASADAAVQQAHNWAASEMAKVDADLAIARQETDKRIADARTRRDALIAEAEGTVLAEMAQVKAEIERQKARALQVKRKLDADIVQVAEADRRAREEEARGFAARVIERGKAEATALRSVFEAFTGAGEGAREVMTLQQVIPLLAQVSGAGRKLTVDKVTVLPADGDDGGGFAKAAISASEQLKAAIGLDVTQLAKRLEGSGAKVDR
jgi:flotillin